MYVQTWLLGRSARAPQLLEKTPQSRLKANVFHYRARRDRPQPPELRVHRSGSTTTAMHTHVLIDALAPSRFVNVSLFSNVDMFESALGQRPVVATQHPVTSPEQRQFNQQRMTHLQPQPGPKVKFEQDSGWQLEIWSR